VDFIGFSDVEAIENIVGTRTDKTYFYKRIAPYHEDRLREILSNNPVIASVGHRNSNSKLFSHGYATDRFLRARGYRVYTVVSHPENIADTSDAPIFNSIHDVPQKVDMLVYHSSEYDNRIIEIALQAGAKVIFPSYQSFNKNLQVEAERNGIEFVLACGIAFAYRRLFASS
jgi:predicted CoA-binding protein